jgi:hypothetical protein
MIKIFCDLCGKEIDKRCDARSLYRIKRKSYTPETIGRAKWEDLVVHDLCVEKLLKKSEETKDD